MAVFACRRTSTLIGRNCLVIREKNLLIWLYFDRGVLPVASTSKKFKICVYYDRMLRRDQEALENQTFDRSKGVFHRPVREQDAKEARMKFWIAAICLGAGVLAGCADTHELIRSSQTPGPVMRPTDSVYVAVPKDGAYGSATYRGSGATTAGEFVSAFGKRLRRVEGAHEYQSFEDALKTARSGGFTYLVFPTILHWEDRATEWSGKSDRVEVKVELVEVGSGRTVDSTLIKGKSKWATLGGDHPQDLLPKPIDEFVAALFGAT